MPRRWSVPVALLAERWYGVTKNYYVGVVEFSSEVRARTVNGVGQINHRLAIPQRPAELHGRDEFKPAWTTREQVRAIAVRSYRPGEEL